jgi:hypothetical protein
MARSLFGECSRGKRTTETVDELTHGKPFEVENPSALISQLLAAGHIGSEVVVEYRGRRILPRLRRETTSRGSVR